MESLNFKLQTEGKSTIKGTLAYPPPGPRLSFCNIIPDFIATLAIDSKDYLFIGDLNFHLNNPSNLLESMSNIGLKKLVTSPTHYAGHVLDLIFTSSNRGQFSYVTELTWSDHAIVYFTIARPPLHKPPSAPT